MLIYRVKYGSLRFKVDKCTASRVLSNNTKPNPWILELAVYQERVLMRKSRALVQVTKKKRKEE